MRRLAALACLFALVPALCYAVPSAREHYAQLTAGSADYQVTFTDIADVDWAHTAIATLAAQGVISGVGGTSFAPHRELTKREYFKLLISTLGILDEDAHCSFSDLSQNDWGYPYAAAAVRAGMIADGGSFASETPITRGDIAILTTKGLAAIGLEAGDLSEVDGYTDRVSVPIEAYCLRKMGVMNGDLAGTFRPLDTCTRAEAAQIIYNLSEYIKKNW